MTRSLLTLALALTATLATFGDASAHPTLQVQEAKVGASYRAVMRVPHGCDGSATTKIRILIPEGVIAAKPMPKPGWSLEIVRGAYAKGYKFYHGSVLTEGAKELIWTGRLPDEHYDEFVFSATIADTLTAGTTLHFPVHQECEKGKVAWTEVAAPGQSAHDLKSPAATLALTTGTRPAAIKIGALAIEAPWIRATPGGVKVAGGYMKITNTGSEPDRLIGGSLAAAAAVEVHEMKMVGDVMNMRRLEQGLEIKPGETVELKPGSYHVMFMGLSRPLTEGQSVTGTLRFEKAGTIDVTYRVAPIGAQSGGKHDHH